MANRFEQFAAGATPAPTVAPSGNRFEQFRAPVAAPAAPRFQIAPAAPAPAASPVRAGPAAPDPLPSSSPASRVQVEPPAPAAPAAPAGGLFGFLGDMNRAYRGASLEARDALVPPPAGPVDPFAGESFGALASRRGQQFVAGAADAAAGVPEGLALGAASGDAGIKAQAPAAITAALGRLEAAETALRSGRSQMDGSPMPQSERDALLRSAEDARLAIDGWTAARDRAPAPVSDNPIFKTGEDIRKWAAAKFGAPDPRDTGLWGMVAQGAGNMGVMLGAGLVPGAGLPLSAGIGVGMGASGQYRDALEAGADEATALDAAGLGALVGATEIVPIASALKFLPERMRAAVTDRVMTYVGNLAIGGSEEAIQEGVAQIANNLIASNLYDPERGWSEGVTESMIVGGILGTGVAGLTSAPDLIRGAPKPPAADPVAAKRAAEAAQDEALYQEGERVGREIEAAKAAGRPLEEVRALQDRLGQITAERGRIASPIDTDKLREGARLIEELIAPKAPGSVPDGAVDASVLFGEAPAADPAADPALDGLQAGLTPGPQAGQSGGGLFGPAPDPAAVKTASDAAIAAGTRIDVNGETVKAPAPDRSAGGSATPEPADAQARPTDALDQAFSDAIDEFAPAPEADALKAALDAVNAEKPYTKEWYAAREALMAARLRDEAAAPAPETPNAEAPLYDRAVALVRESNRASAAFVQRKLRLGYAESAALIERMEAEGVVSAPSRAGGRSVLPPPAPDTPAQGSPGTGFPPAENAPVSQEIGAESGQKAPNGAPINEMTKGETRPTVAPPVLLDPDELEVDPETFQFKTGGDAAGVTDQLRGVETWDQDSSGQAIVWERRDGKRFVVDGHQRLGLAKRLKAAGQNPKIVAVVKREADGVTAADARFQGAMKNLREGGESTKAYDVARVFREGGDPEAVATSIPRTRRAYQDGLALAKLGPDAWGMVVNEVVDAATAAEVGRVLSNPDQQTAALGFLAKAKPRNQNEVRLIVEQIRDAGFAEGTQDSLFGPEAFAETLYGERARILDNASNFLKSLGRVFKTAVDSAAVLTAAGNALDADANVAGMSENQRLGVALARLANRKGPISDALNEQARRLKSGDTDAAGARKAFLDAVSRLDAGAANGAGAGGERDGGSAGSDPESPAEEVSPTPAGDLFGGPGQSAARPRPAAGQSGQLEIPGAEASATQLAASMGNRPKGGRKPQEDADLGLFAPKPDTSPGLFDAPEAGGSSQGSDEADPDGQPDDWYGLSVKPVDEIFPAPAETLNVWKVAGPYLEPDEAAERLAAWKAEAARQKASGVNANRVIISLFDYTGEWSKPYVEAGFEVLRYDVRHAKDREGYEPGDEKYDDLLAFIPTGDIRDAREAGKEIYGVLAATPCTSYAVSGARWWETHHDAVNPDWVKQAYGEWAAEMFDRPIDVANGLVAVTEAIIELANPTTFHVMENPVGRIASQNDLPKPTASFQPHNFGDPYTKKTLLWGDFDPNMPTANVDPVEGSKIHMMSSGDKERSKTPEGFAWAFFMANSPTTEASAAGQSTGGPAAAPPSLAVTIEPLTDKSVIVRGVGKDEAARFGDMGKVTPLWNAKQEGWVFSAKHEGKLRERLGLDAPAADQNPVKNATPGTRGIEWSNLAEWMDGAIELNARRVSTGRYAQEKAHWEALEPHAEAYVAAASKDDLSLMRRLLTATSNAAWTKPPRGSRGGTLWERVNQRVTDRLVQIARAEQAAPSDGAKTPGEGIKSPTPAAADPARDARLPDWTGIEIPDQSEIGERGDNDGGPTKDRFLTTSRQYLGSVAKLLREQGFEAHPVKGAKGKPDKPGQAISANKGGPAVSGEVMLEMIHPSGAAVYVQISVAMMGRVTIMARRASAADRYGARSQNQWLPADTKAGMLADRLVQISGLEAAAPTAAAGPRFDGPRPFADGDEVMVRFQAPDREEAGVVVGAPYKEGGKNGTMRVSLHITSGPNPGHVNGVEVSRVRLATEADKAAVIAAAAAEADPNPTPAQAEAGNYRKGHVTLHGLEISIETAKGETRSKVGKSGKAWSVVMPAHYGHILGTAGADGDQVDVYIGDFPESRFAYVVDQYDPETGAFDEHKVVLGVQSGDEARRLYNGGFSDGSGPRRGGGMLPLTIAEFKAWLETGDTTKPVEPSTKPADVSETADPVTRPADTSPEMTDGPDALDQAFLDAIDEFAPAPPAEVAPDPTPEGWADFAKATQKTGHASTAVPCPDCGAKALTWCVRPSGHKAMDLHAARKTRADDVFIEQHGPDAWIETKDVDGKSVTTIHSTGFADEAAEDAPAAPALPGRADAEAIADALEAFAATAGAPWSANATNLATGIRWALKTATKTFDDGTLEFYRGRLAEFRQRSGAAGQSEGYDLDRMLEPDAKKKRAELREEKTLAALEAVDAEIRRLADEINLETGLTIAEVDSRASSETVAKRKRISELGGKASRLIKSQYAVQRGYKNAKPAQAAQNLASLQAGLAGEPEPASPRPAAPRPQAGQATAGRPAAPGATYPGMSPPTAGQAASSAATNAAEGLKDVAAGLWQLFGDPNKLSSGFTFDAESYAKAKPLFIAAAKHFKAAAGDVSAMARALVKALVEDFGFDRPALVRMQPYLRRFVEDVASGEVELDTPEVAPRPSDATSPAPDLNTPEGERQAIAEAFRDAFAAGTSFKTIVQARKLASDTIGRPIVEADLKMVEEAVEAGVVMRARDIVAEGRRQGRADAETYQAMVDLYAAQPGLRTRTSTSVEQQAYSTPAPLAYLASRLAGIDADTTVYEPSAGNGMLLMEASPGRIMANELNPDRHAALVRLFGDDADVTMGDGVTNEPPAPAAVVIANPPFGKVKREDGTTIRYDLDGRPTTEIDHAISWKALQAMEEGGRAVLIIGGHRGQTDEERREGYRITMHSAFQAKLYQQFNVTEHFTIDGSLYAKQGAEWPIDVIVVNGRGASAKPLPASVPPVIYPSWEALKGRLDGSERRLDSLDARPDREPRLGSDQAPDGGNAGTAGVSGRPGGSDRPAGGGGRTGGRAESSPDRGDGGTRPVDPANAPDGGRPADGEQRPTGGNGGRDPVPGPAGADPARAGNGGDAGGRDSGGVSGPALPGGQRLERENRETETAFQIRYTPTSNAAFAVGTLVPRNMQDAMDAALGALAERVGDIDDFVARRLQYSRDELLGTPEKEGYFSAEQVDALALAIDNVENGAGFVIGDQTGVGKGRVVAAMLRYGMLNGKTPIFVTKQPGLYADMIRDLRDIGMPDIAGAVLPTNHLRGKNAIPLSATPGDVLTSQSEAKHKAAIASIARTGDLPAGFRMMFTTYSQMQYAVGGSGVLQDRQLAMQALAANSIIVLDESHEAGGSESKTIDPETGEEKPTRADFFRGMLGLGGGVVYSSATYAKNPIVMSLYFRTDIGLAVEDISQLAPTIAKGGVPLQQVVANMLVESGQYVRRERSYDGVEIKVETLPTNAKMGEAATTALRNIFALDTEFMTEVRENYAEGQVEEGDSAVRDDAIGEGSAGSTNFASIMHVVVSQMLLSLKAKATVDQAIALHREGKKPIIALSNTNAAILVDYMDEAGLRPGDEAQISFNAILERYLRRLRRITLKDPDGKKRYVYLTDDQILEFGTPDALDEMKRVEKLVREMDLSELPGSPIDYVIDRLNAAGVRTGEITGRTITVKDGVITAREAGDAAKKREMNDYNSGALDALVINKSGSTGFSMHATGKADNDGKPRHMIVLQPDANIDVFMQMLGRIHRTGQIKLPSYTIGVSDLAVEKRAAAVLMRKMASLNANTTASKTSSVSLDNVTDFLNIYGDRVVNDYLRENTEVSNAIDLEPSAPGDIEGKAAKFTGRLAILPPAQVAAIYDAIEGAYNDFIAALDAMGMNALEAKTLELDARSLGSVELVPAREGETSVFGAAAMVETMDVRKIGKPMTSAEVEAAVKKELGARGPDAYVASRRDQLDKAMPALEAKIAQGKDRATAAGIEAKTDKQRDKAADALRRWELASEMAQGRLDAIKGAVETYRPGQSFMLRIEDGETSQTVYAVSLGTDLKGVRDNPTAASAIKVRFAIADAGREIRVPLSKLIDLNGGYDATPVSGQGHFEVAAPEAAAPRIGVTRDGQPFYQFDTVRMSGREYSVGGRVPGVEGEYYLRPVGLNASVRPERDRLSDIEANAVFVKAGPYNPAARTASSSAVRRAFDDGQNEAREQRQMITGNILAGFSVFQRGRITMFTDAQGTVRQGILMPRNFDAAREMAQRPVQFRDPKHVVRFLQDEPGRRMVKSGDGKVAITYNGTDFAIRVATQGGKPYTLNREVRALIGDFQKRGGQKTFSASARAGQLERVLAIYQENLGATFETDGQKDEARAITGEQLLASPTEGNSNSGGTLPPMQFSRARTATAPTATPAFKRWFGKSKVIDDDGGPLVVYHGTKGDFDAFARGRWPETINDIGSWFSSDAGDASKFAGTTGGAVMPVYLRIENPLYVDTTDQLKALWREHAGGGSDLRGGDAETFRAWVRSQGHDGLSMSGGDVDGFARGVYMVALDPEQIKSAFNRGSFDSSDPRLSFAFTRDGTGLATGVTPFYSATLRAAEGLTQAKGNGLQFLAMLRKTPGVKQEELDWLGVPAWLGDRKTVTKDELVAYLRDNQVRVEEVWHNAAESRVHLEERGDGEGGTEYVLMDDVDTIDTFDNADEAYDALDAYTPASRPTKYGDYVLPGADNYRELLIALPLDPEAMMAEADRTGQTYRTVEATSGYRSSHWDTPNVLAHVRINERSIETPLTAAELAIVARMDELRPEYDRLQAEIARVANLGGSTEAYRVRDDAIRARVRSREISMAEGNRLIEEPLAPDPAKFAKLAELRAAQDALKMPRPPKIASQRVLVIEEIQSDAHQAGRKHGYATKPLSNAEAVALVEERRRLLRVAANDETPAADVAAANERIAEIGRTIAATNRPVPDLPLKTTWQETAFRRAVAHAIELGMDAVAWPDGAAQAERYDLSKRVKEIEYILQPDGKTYLLGIADMNGQSIDLPKGGMFKAEELPDVVGKEIAEKIVAGEGRRFRGHEGRTLSGLDLKVGGEGMKGFYDRILPAYAKKWGKAFGATVSQTKLDVPYDSETSPSATVWTMTITDAMRAAVEAQGGVPLFARPEAAGRPDMPAEATAGRPAGQGRPALPRLSADARLEVVFTGVFAAKAAAVEADLKAQLAALKLGGHVDLAVAEMLFAGGDQVDGLFRADGIIAVSLASSRGVAHTFGHEALHALRSSYLFGGSHGLFRAAEWRTLETAAAADEARVAQMRKDRPGLDEEAILEEVIADMYGDWRAGRLEAKGFVRTAFERIRDFLAAVGNALRGQGFETPGSIFRRIDRGDVGGRAADQAFKRWFGKSKMVDAAGKPLVLYHGSPNDIAAFEGGAATDADDRRNRGIYFTKDPRYAQAYADSPTRAQTATAGPAIYPVHLKIENPKVIGAPRMGVAEALRAFFAPRSKTAKLAAEKRRVEAARQSAYLPALKIEQFKAQGYDGIINLAANEIVVFDSAQVKSAFNRGTFDPADPRISFARPTSAATPPAPPAQRPRKGLARRALDVAPIDAAFRTPIAAMLGGTNATGELKAGVKAFDRVSRLVTEAKFKQEGRFDFFNPALEQARRGLIDRYGLDAEYVERDRVRGMDERRVLLQAQEVIKILADKNMGAAEAAVLQDVLTGEAVGSADMQKLAAPIRRAIDALGAEAVELGLLSPESFERNRGAYLHRVYMKDEGDATRLGKWAGDVLTKRRQKIIGNQFKGRGIFEKVKLGDLMKHVPEWRGGATGVPNDGDKFVMLDLVDEGAAGGLPGVEGRKARVKKRVYVRADRPIPSEFADYENRGTFEVRGKQGGDMVLWRDFTKVEREKMGEIVDARYTVAKTYMLMARDLATGRFFKDIATNEGWSQEGTPDQPWASAEEYNRRWSDPSIEWVRVPETKISKSNTYRYGALAGRYVRAEIWRDLAELEALQNPNLWDRIMRQWKMNKTIRNPVVHLNNVMSNLILMDLAGVSAGDLADAAGELRRKGPAYEAAAAMGAFGSDMVAQELRENTLKPLLEELQNVSRGDKRGGASDVLGWVGSGIGMERPFAAAGALADGVGRGLGKADKFMQDAYQVEDEVFRLAVYMRRVAQGHAPQRAALEARDQFLNYDIRAPWINAARRTALPFLSYTYRAAPVLAKTIAARPWKLAKYATLMFAWNAMAYALAPSEDDEEEERGSMRDEEQGYTWMMTPRMMRMPMLDAEGNPIFLDVRRFVPAGDVFDVNAGSGVFDLPSWLNPGGPIALAAELYLNRSSFTGQDIVNPTIDGAATTAQKTAAYLWQAWMPSAAWVPGSWYFQKIGDAYGGGLDWQMQPMNLPMAVSSSFGVKLRAQDVETGYAGREVGFSKVERALKSEATRLTRLYERNLMSEQAFMRAMDDYHAQLMALEDARAADQEKRR